MESGFGINETEWAEKVEIRKEGIHGRRRIMHDSILSNGSVSVVLL